MHLLLLTACVGDPVFLDTGKGRDTGTPDETGDSGDSGETADTHETGETGDTQETGETAGEGDLTLTLDKECGLMVHAAWSGGSADTSWVEYRFDDDTWLVAPAIGDGDAVLIGIPEQTEVEARAAWTSGGETQYSATATITTGALPKDLLEPEVSVWDPTLGWDADYAMISISGGDWSYMAPYWIEIFDREGRIVWYFEVPDDMMTFYPTISRDGTHIWYEAEDIFGMGSADPSVTRRTLDGRWSQTQEVPSLGEAIAEGPDDSWFYEYRSHNVEVRQLWPDGSYDLVWDCGEWFDDHGIQRGYCAMNTCNWDESRNTVLASQFYTSTVFEIDVDTHEPIRQMGQLDEGEPWSFDPSTSMFDYQHNPYWLENGNLLVSTHIEGVNGKQVAAEYEVDDETKTLHRVWSYQSNDIWATQVGEAIRLENGNTIQGYGEDGWVREVTTDGDVVWEVTWDRDVSGARVVGHTSLIQDLYALNVGR